MVARGVPMGRMDNRGQATVELALCLPIVVALLAVLLQVGFVVSDQVKLWHAAREAVRVAAVDGDEAHIEDAATRSGPDDISIAVAPRGAGRRQGEPVRVSLRHNPGGRVPLIGLLFENLTLTADATMRIEQP